MKHIKKQYHKDVICRLQRHPKYKSFSLERLVDFVKFLFPQYRKVDITEDVRALMVS